MKRFLCLILAVFFLCSPALAASNGGEIVYITRTGECYHMGSCGYLRKSKIEITLSDAVSRGYRPCSRCHPPRLVEYTPTPTPRPTATPTPRLVTTQTTPTPKPNKQLVTTQATATPELRAVATPTPTPKLTAKEETKNAVGDITAKEWLVFSVTFFIPMALAYGGSIVYHIRRKK